MKPSGLLSAALVLVATNSSAKTLAAPVPGTSQEMSRDAPLLHRLVAAPARRSGQAPIVDHASKPSAATVSFGTKEAASTSTRPDAEPEEDLVETIIDDAEARRREIEDLVLSVKSSRVRESLMLEEDFDFEVRYEDLPDRPIDDPTRWMAAKELGKKS
ncbi:hypothetical protein SLS58_007679 [Diplodia intermedia]|uniref:Uncharacterized protein n=1 Tax=Diplodia intermedia TaxID=856260 RepID=A0ABR3TJN5_9PEZI